MGKLAAALTVFAGTVVCFVKIANADPTGRQPAEPTATAIDKKQHHLAERLHHP
jgi:hypothetical protein